MNDVPLFKQFLVMMFAGYVAAEMASIGPANHSFVLSIWYGFAAAAMLHLSGRLWNMWCNR